VVGVEIVAPQRVMERAPRARGCGRSKPVAFCQRSVKKVLCGDCPDFCANKNGTVPFWPWGRWLPPRLRRVLFHIIIATVIVPAIAIMETSDIDRLGKLSLCRQGPISEKV
jgi:hypothetical protein